MTWRNVLTGCPMMQFVNEGGSTWRLFAIIWLVWLVNLPLALLVGALVLLLGIICTPAIYFYNAYALLILLTKKLDRIRVPKLFIVLLHVLVTIPIIFLCMNVAYCLIIAVIGLIVTIILALFALIVTPLITLFVPLYTAKIFVLRCIYRG